MIKIPIKIGDTILGGRFKNMKVVVKTIGKNEKGDFTINGKPLLRFRIPDKPIEECLIMKFKDLLKEGVFDGPSRNKLIAIKTNKLSRFQLLHKFGGDVLAHKKQYAKHMTEEEALSEIERLSKEHPQWETKIIQAY